MDENLFNHEKHHLHDNFRQLHGSCHMSYYLNQNFPHHEDEKLKLNTLNINKIIDLIKFSEQELLDALTENLAESNEDYGDRSS